MRAERTEAIDFKYSRISNRWELDLHILVCSTSELRKFFSLKKFQNFKNLTVKFLKFNERNGQKNENSIQLITYQFDTLNEL